MSAIKLNTGYQGIDGAAMKVSHELLCSLGAKEILVKITHTGLCGTDLHAVTFNSVLGNESFGIVEAAGSAVTQFKVSDRTVGGFLRYSCGHSNYCLSGQDMWYYKRDIFLESDKRRDNGTVGDYYATV